MLNILSETVSSYFSFLKKVFYSFWCTWSVAKPCAQFHRQSHIRVFSLSDLNRPRVFPPSNSGPLSHSHSRSRMSPEIKMKFM